MNNNPDDFSQEYHPETLAIRAQAARSEYREHSVPLYMTSSFVFDDAEQARALFADEIPGNIYTRFSNPNNTEFIEKLMLLEGAEDGIATASGMAAMFVSLAGLLHSGDHVVASRSVFGSTHQLFTQILPRWGIQHSYVEIQDNAAWEAAIRPETKMLFLETPSNPRLDLADLEFLGRLAAARGLILNVDNCFATPVLQQPLRWGAHIVTHSATKFIDGQGRAIGGAIVGNSSLIKTLRYFARHTGPALSPFNGWLLSKSLETLHVRMDRHCSQALEMARWLQEQPAIQAVFYPFLENHPQYALAQRQMLQGGGVLSFELEGGLSSGRNFQDALRMISRSANLGDIRSIATHPASTTHARLSPEERLSVGISDGLIRLSVGLEHPDDIKADIRQALLRAVPAAD